MPDEIQTAIAGHETAWHTFVDREAIAHMVEEHNEMVGDLGMMIDDLYGERRPTPGDPDRRIGGRLTNGALKVQVPTWIVAVISGSFLLLAAIATALIAAVLGA